MILNLELAENLNRETLDPRSARVLLKTTLQKIRINCYLKFGIHRKSEYGSIGSQVCKGTSQNKVSKEIVILNLGFTENLYREALDPRSARVPLKTSLQRKSLFKI